MASGQKERNVTSFGPCWLDLHRPQKEMMLLESRQTRDICLNLVRVGLILRVRKKKCFIYRKGSVRSIKPQLSRGAGLTHKRIFYKICKDLNFVLEGINHII